MYASTCLGVWIPPKKMHLDPAKLVWIAWDLKMNLFPLLNWVKGAWEHRKKVRQMNKSVKMSNVSQFKLMRASSGCKQYFLYRWSGSGQGSLVQRHRRVSQVVCAGLVCGRHQPDTKDKGVSKSPIKLREYDHVTLYQQGKQPTTLWTLLKLYAPAHSRPHKHTSSGSSSPLEVA